MTSDTNFQKDRFEEKIFTQSRHLCSKMIEQEGSVSSSGMRFAKLEGTNYWEWVMDMQDFLQREALWRLTIGKEEILGEPKEESSFNRDYEKNKGEVRRSTAEN